MPAALLGMSVQDRLDLSGWAQRQADMHLVRDVTGEEEEGSLTVHSPSGEPCGTIAACVQLGREDV